MILQAFLQKKKPATCVKQLKKALYKKGKPIPTNDVWIASLAKQHGFTLVTTDKHFNEIPGLQFKKW